MASVRIPSSRFSAGDLPEICARTGRLARSRYRLVATGSSGPVPGMVPLSRGAVRELRTKRLASAALLSYGALSVLAGAVLSSTVVLIAGIALLVAGSALVAWLLAGFVVARVSHDGEWITLTRVHDAFVAALSGGHGKCEGCTESTPCSVAGMRACEPDGEGQLATN